MAEDISLRRPLRLTRALVDKVPTEIDDPGPVAEIAELQSDAAHNARMAQILHDGPDKDAFWIFAFGSLIWQPGFEIAEQRDARLDGWHRSFCLGPDTRYRGNPDAPGIMLSLDRGGSCDGVALRMCPKTLSDDLNTLMQREPPLPPVWQDVMTPQGSVSALCFVNDPDWMGYVGDKTCREIAEQIAPAVGIFGSMADYVFNIATHLLAAGIDDDHVWEVQDQLARKLETMQ